MNTPAAPAIRAVILTALALEYQAVRAQLHQLQEQSVRGTQFEIGTIPGTDDLVALCNVGEGNLATATIAERALAKFSPEALLFVGVAGGLKSDVHLGDIVVATKVYHYQGGKAADRFRTRPAAWQASHRLEQLARQVVNTERLPLAFAGRSLPHVHFKPIASGDVVVAERRSATFRLIAQTYSDAAAVEMEGAGSALAAHLGETGALVVRGISDTADATKHERDAEGWQELAATNAAVFAVEMIRRVGPSNLAYAIGNGFASGSRVEPSSAPEVRAPSRALLEVSDTALHELPRVSNLGGVVPADSFLERASLSGALADLVGQNEICVVQGNAAVGKSELVLRLAGHLEAPIRWWIDASSTASIEAGVNQLGQALDFPSRNTGFDLLAEITRYPDIFLVLDGIQQDSDISRIKSACAGGAARVVLTSTVQPRMALPTLEVPELNFAETLQLLRLTLPGYETAELISLAEMLRGLPLAVWQASGYLRETGMAVDRYLTMVTETPHTVLRKGLPSGPEYRSIASVWDGSLALVDAASHEAVTSLLGLHVLGGAQVVRGHWLGCIGFSLCRGESLGDEGEARELDALLRRLRLIQSAGDRVQAHALLLSYVWATAPAEQRSRAVHSAMKTTDLLTAFLQSMGDSRMVEELHPLGVSLATTFAEWADPEQLVRTVMKIAGYQLAMSHADLAAELVALLLKVKNSNQELHVDVLANYVQCLIAEERSADVLLVLDRLLASVSDSLSPRVRLGAYGVAARAYWEVGRPQEAADACARCTALLPAVDLEDPAVTVPLVNYRWIAGTLALHNGDVDSAMRHYGEGLDSLDDTAVSIWREETAASIQAQLHRYGLTPPDWLDERIKAAMPTRRPAEESARSLPRAVLLQADLARAPSEMMAARSRLLDLYAAHSGSTDRITLSRIEVMQHYARTQIEELNFEGAQDTVNQALELLRELPREALEASEARKLHSGLLVNLANVLVSRSKLAEAFKCTAEALRIDAEEFGENHHEYAMDAMVHAGVLCAMGRVSAAIKWAERSLRIWEHPGRFFDVANAQEAREFIELLRRGRP